MEESQTDAPPQCTDGLRKAEEVFIFMHRNFRVSRNIRAHWFFDHINRTVSIEDDSPADDEYGQEMSVVGILPKGGKPDEIVGRERFLVTHDTKVVYVSRYYRHVYVLDLSPSTMVSDEDCDGCLHSQLVDCLKLSLESSTKSFTKPGTNSVFYPQIYISVVVFVPFLTFEEDLVLAHSILVTEANVQEVMTEVRVRFTKLLRSLYTFSRPIMHKWAHLRRIHKNRYESIRESDVDVIDCSILNDENKRPNAKGIKMKDVAPIYERRLSTINMPKRIFEIEDYDSDKPDEPGVEGYIIPEWALIFMLRLGLLSVQTLPENTQSNIIVITDGVAGMPDPQALQDLMNQMRSFTVSCSFIEIPQMVQKGTPPENKVEPLIIKTRSRHQPCFGHVTSCELFHFLAMATFGGYLPNFCSLKKSLDEEVGDFRAGFLSVNKYHRCLLCWSFQNALQDNKYITQLVMEMNPIFASLYKNKTTYHLEFNRSYVSTLNELLYVRLREGFTVKSVEIRIDSGRINIHLCLPFRPLVFLEYAIDASWPSCRTKRETINVDLVVTGPDNEIRDLQMRDNGDIHVYNPLRLKLIDTLKTSIHRIEEADSLLIHIHSFNTDAAFYSLPRGADEYPIHHLEDARKGLNMYNRINVVPIVRCRTNQDDFGKFLRFWGVLCNMNQDNWQKWVHVHFERVILNCKKLPCNAFTQHGIKIQCTDSHKALHQLLKKRSSFCLIKDQLYVTFVKRRNDNVPCYFYMVHVSQEVPCVVMKTAFLGGISSTERRRVVELFRRALTDLSIRPLSQEKAVTVIRRPLERILVRYQVLPGTLKTIVRMKPANEKAKPGEAMEQAMHTVVNKYLVGRRHIWRLPLSILVDGPDDSRNSRRVAEFVLSALLHRRIEEGFSVAWSHNGIVGLCRQVEIGPRSLLEQYILFHPANRTADDDLNVKLDSGLVLVSELWREPCADDDDFPALRPETASDNELVSVLYTVNHLLLICASHSGPLTFVEHTEEQVESKLSRCVSMVTNVFNLYDLLKNSRRLLLHLPTFNTGEVADDRRMAALHASYLAEFANFCSVSVDISEPLFFAKVLSRMLVDDGDSRVDLEEYEAQGYDSNYLTGCRMFIRQVNPWVALVIIVPDFNVFDGSLDFPVIVSICDEALLAYGLVKRETVSRFNEFTLKKTDNWTGADSFPAEDLVNESLILNWVSNDRRTRTLITNYVQVRMKTVVQELNQTVVDRALASAIYTLLRAYVPLSKEDVAFVLEELCPYNSIEIEAVNTALETFCSHLKPDYPNDGDCCQETNLKKVFEEVLDRRFLPVPCNTNYFYFTPHPQDRVKPVELPPRPEEKKDGVRAAKESTSTATATSLESVVSPKKSPEKADMATVASPQEAEKASTVPSENQSNSAPKRKNSNTLADSEVSPGEVSVKNSDSSEASRIALKQAMAEKRINRARAKFGKDDREHPLFLYFTCGARFPSGVQEDFPVAFFPTCANQVLNLCQKAAVDEDVSKIQVRLLVYVLTWPTYRPFADALDSGEEDEDALSGRSDLFLAKLPERERAAVNELLLTMNRVLELESLLIDSRRDDITHEKLLKISSFIAREVGDSFSDNGKNNMCKTSGMGNRVTQRIRELSLVLPSPEAIDDLKKRLENMVVDYCVLRRSGNSNVYYICRVEDKEAFEHQVKTHLSRGHSNKLTSTSEEQAQEGTEVSRPPSRKVSIVDNAYISDSLLQDFDLSRKDLLCDFWVILTVDNTCVTLQFCQRYATEPSHYKIYDLTWKLARQTIRIINQELLLHHMFEKRECHSLLMTKEVASSPDGVVSLGNESILDEDVSWTSNPDSPFSGTAARYTFAPGSFACPVQWMKWLEIHPRLRSKNPNGLLYEAASILRRGLEQHMVMNIPNTFVFKEENGNVLYFQIYTSFETFTNSLQSYSVELTKAEIAEAKVRMESNTCILVAGFGVRKPSETFSVGLTTELLEKKLNQRVLEKLIDIWKRNPRSLLDPADIEFIQPDETRPVAVMHFSIPFGLSRFMSGVSYYYHQYLQMFTHAARIRETQSGESRPFRPYPLLSREAMDRQYAPVFYLCIKSGQEGSRLKGIACVEMRIVNAHGEMEPLSDGVLRLESHKALVKNSRDTVVVQDAFDVLTRSEAELVMGQEAAAVNGRPITPSRIDGICGYIQIILWQADAGDVGIPELKHILHIFAEQSFCDVVTEYGILNVNVLESGTLGSSLLPPQSPVSTTPQKLSPKSSPGPSDAAAARRSFRKRDSTEILQQLPPNGSSDTSSMKRGSSGFTLSETRRGSIASELGREEIVLPVSRDRAPERVSGSFYPSIEQWMSFVVSNHEFYGNSFECFSYQFDSFSIVRKALFILRQKIEEMSSKADILINPLLVDRVIVCERVHRNKEEFYEVLNPDRDNTYLDESSAASDDAPQYMLIAYCHEVSKESQRYGYEKTASEPPAVLKQLLNQMDKKDNLWNFLPCLTPFIPRRRVMYCSVRGNTISLYMYNYMADKVRHIDEIFTRTVCWWNAKARLIKEINRTPETNVLLSEFRYKPNNTYMPLVFQDPLSLSKLDYPPDNRKSQTVRMDIDLARRLFRSHKRFAPVFQSSCPITRHLKQFECMREEVEKQIEEYQRVQEIHERLLRGIPDIRENDLGLLQSCARRVHYVQTPVLLFPHWRRKVGEVRYTGNPEPRHVTSPPRAPGFMNSGSLGTARTRASTMHQQNNAIIRQPTAREDDDPCHIIMLYKLMKQYVDYLKMLGLQLFNVTDLLPTSRARNYYSTEYKRNSGGGGNGSYPPSVCLFRAVEGGIVIVRLFFVKPYFIIAVGMWTVPELLLRDQPFGDTATAKLSELEDMKDMICSRCHVHSFTYDFHLRMMERYLVHQEVLFSHGYNTNTFLLDFLNYYGCRPPNARNCVYEERSSFQLPESISASNVWECFLNKNYEEKFNWRVVRIRVTDEENDAANVRHENEYMLVSSEMNENEEYSRICVLIKDKRKKETQGMLHLALYLILIDKDQTRPMDEVRHREDSRQSDVGEFRNVLQPTEEQLESEIEAMMNMVNSGKLPAVDGVSRRRFSSGGHTTPVTVNTDTTGSGEQSPMAVPERVRGSDSDLSIAIQGSGTLRHRSQPVGDEDGEIPGEKVVYVQFLSTAQRDLQQLLEDTTKTYCQRVTTAVQEANRQCRIEFLWNTVNALPTHHTVSLPRLGPLAKGGASELIWELLRTQILHEVGIDELYGLIPLVTFENMDQRDQRMKSLLQGTSCARLCRFLVYKFGPARCRLFESYSKDLPNSEDFSSPLDTVFPFRKALVVTDPANPVLFLVTCRGEDTPNILMLFRKAIDYEGSQQQMYFGSLMDKAFDELVQCVTAFLWADLVYKPPSKNLQ